MISIKKDWKIELAEYLENKIRRKNKEIIVDSLNDLIELKCDFFRINIYKNDEEYSLQVILEFKEIDERIVLRHYFEGNKEDIINRIKHILKKLEPKKIKKIEKDILALLKD